MNKIFPIVLVIILVAGAWYFIASPDEKPTPDKTSSSTRSGDTGVKQDDTSGPDKDRTSGVPGQSDQVTDIDDDLYEEDIRPATDLYNSAEDAFEAVKKGAVDYDDLVLEQFAELGEDCTWCPDFYSEIKTAMLEPDASEDFKSYYAEILAISGKPDNLETLIDAIKEAQDEDSADIFAEALEVTLGDNKTVEFLGNNLESDNELLKESVIAAITNHGSPLAIDLLYQETIKEKDPDGFYSLGIGLGEVIPDEESLPYLTELANKRDSYSHLAVKALLNYGVEGLRSVVDIISNSQDNEVSRQMLEDAIDHVNFEEETEEYVKELAKSATNPVVKQFAKEVLEDFELEEDEEEEFIE